MTSAPDGFVEAADGTLWPTGGHADGTLYVFGPDKTWHPSNTKLGER